MTADAWEKRSRDGRSQGSTFDIIEREPRRRVAAMVAKSDADAIISDHAKAALLDEREEEMRALAYLLRDALAEGQGIKAQTHTEGGKAWREALTRLRDVPVHDSKGGA